MPRRVLAFAWALFLGVLFAGPAWAVWIENHVHGDEVRVEIDRDGKAVVEHRLTLQTNGSRRQHRFELVGVDADAAVMGDSYVIPSRDALSGSLQNAIPLKLSVEPRDEDDANSPRVLVIEVDDKRGLWRGSFLFVLRYATDLRTRGRIRRDGAMLRVDWTGPDFPDGFDSARVTFRVPHAPTPPRGVGAMSEEEDVEPRDEEPAAVTFLTEVQAGSEQDEIELLRTYARVHDPITWAIRVDPRALAPLPPAPEAAARPDDDPSTTPAAEQTVSLPPGRVQLGVGAGLALLVLLVVVGKTREARRVAGEARATVRPLLPLPLPVRAPLAGLAFAGGLALELVADRPILGALAIVLAAWAGAMGGPRVDPKASMRGPGSWLTLTEKEGLGAVPRPRGTWLDVSTRGGKALFVFFLTATAAAAVWVGRQSLIHGLWIGFSAVVWVAPFTTGGLRALPPDLAVEPVRFLRRVAVRLRRRKDLPNVRVVPRVRIPTGDVDPDEVRLLVAPRTARRGFISIEIGVTYALGFASRLPMPEVLLRVEDGSACHRELAPLLAKGRSSPGRRPDERVIAFSPRLPSVRMTIEIAAALVTRVRDEETAETEAPSQKRRRRRPRAAAAAADEAA